MSGVPGLSDIPLIGRLFANNHRETQQTDIILTLTPHIVRVLDLTEADLRAVPARDANRRALARRDHRRVAAGPPRDDPNSTSATQPLRRHAACRAAPSRRRSRSRCRARCPARRCRSAPPAPPKKPGGGGISSRYSAVDLQPELPTTDTDYRLTDYRLLPTLSTCAPRPRSRSISEA